MPTAGHALWAEVGGGIIFVTSGETAGARHLNEGGSNSINGKPYMLALPGQPSLRGYYACMVCWNEGALRRNCMQKHGETPFSPLRVFLFSRNSKVRFWVLSSGICGLGSLMGI